VIRLPRGETKPKGVVISQDAQRLYVATGRGNTVAVIDAASRKLLHMIPVGQRPWGLALTPDGQRLYAANGLSNDVSVIDTATGQVIANVKAGDGPWGIVIKP
jgi:YVTN family beta-propeller protein